MSEDDLKPKVKDGLDYWETQPATLDGVLGGFGNGTLPYVDALSSRQFLMSLRPELCLVPSALKPLAAPKTRTKRRTRALDIGAGIGRVTQDVLIHLVDEVVLVEPVPKFIAQAQSRSPLFKGIAEKQKGILFVKSTLQDFDPRQPPDETDAKKVFAHAGASFKKDDEPGYDVAWMQWCLGHMSDNELVQLLKATRASLREAIEDDPRTAGLIVVKENCCSETSDGKPVTVWSEEDSSVTRSNLAWIKCFHDAGLTVLRNEVQGGFPEGLYPVRMWALR
ncbi:DUF858-domain-containing protein [Exidia glandulosa HHB12029]|uniref:Alpha N-terminal protein methyltransferase 1 n=1 Tax=Exidia glandulosa HHB12029 TaxID=1314781 RepID=A0A166ABK4_EXIGL|nr:DUF858-domain-containing protein [Exidia glandulosa HHB12029]